MLVTRQKNRIRNRKDFFMSVPILAVTKGSTILGGFVRLGKCDGGIIVNIFWKCSLLHLRQLYSLLLQQPLQLVSARRVLHVTQKILQPCLARHVIAACDGR